MWVARGMPKLDFPGKAFVGFCNKRYQMKQNPSIAYLHVRNNNGVYNRIR